MARKAKAAATTTDETENWVHHVINFLMTQVQDGKGAAPSNVFQHNKKFGNIIRRLEANGKKGKEPDFKAVSKATLNITSVSLAGAYLLHFVNKAGASLMPHEHWFDLSCRWLSLKSFGERLDAIRAAIHCEPPEKRHTFGHVVQLLRMLDQRYVETEVRKKQLAAVVSQEEMDNCKAEFWKALRESGGAMFGTHLRLSVQLSIMQFLLDNSDELFYDPANNMCYNRCNQCQYMQPYEGHQLMRNFWYAGKYVPDIVRDLTQYIISNRKHCCEVPRLSGSSLSRADLKQEYKEKLAVNLEQYFFRKEIEAKDAVHIAVGCLNAFFRKNAERGEMLVIGNDLKVDPQKLHPSIRGSMWHLFTMINAVKDVPRSNGGVYAAHDRFNAMIASIALLPSDLEIERNKKEGRQNPPELLLRCNAECTTLSLELAGIAASASLDKKWKVD